ncbi:MAG TPA: hypothetical protein VHY58_22375, partial [Streptosporangiaceae bacterium]|nr:hypothetical protein [Streptosporangiaceae bacterium]
MHSARPGQAPDHTARPEHTGRVSRGGGRRSRWLLGISGLALLVVSVIMMASGAEPSMAQIVRPAQAPTQLARLRLPTPAGRYPVGTVSPHLIDRSRPNPWVPPGQVNWAATLSHAHTGAP